MVKGLRVHMFLSKNLYDFYNKVLTIDVNYSKPKEIIIVSPYIDNYAFQILFKLFTIRNKIIVILSDKFVQKHKLLVENIIKNYPQLELRTLESLHAKIYSFFYEFSSPNKYTVITSLGSANLTKGSCKRNYECILTLVFELETHQQANSVIDLMNLNIETIDQNNAKILLEIIRYLSALIFLSKKYS